MTKTVDELLGLTVNAQWYSTEVKVGRLRYCNNIIPLFLVNNIKIVIQVEQYTDESVLNVWTKFNWNWNLSNSNIYLNNFEQRILP